jgi:uncharacterized membrane protein
VLSGLASTLALLGVMDTAALFPHLLAARLVVLVIALFLPGALATGAARARFGSVYAQAALVLGASLAVLMAWALVGSTVLPALGVGRPLDKLPFAVGLNVICAGLALASPQGPDPVPGLFKPSGRFRPSLWQLVVCAPALAAAAVERLNTGHGSALTQASVFAAAVSLVVGYRQARAGRHARAQVCLLAASLAVLYLFSLRGNYLFGYDIQQEFQRFSATFARARWVAPANGDPYAAMLSITALPAALSRLTAISGLYLFKGLFPVFVALVPGLSYELASRWLPARAAFAGAAYMVVLADFSSQLPALARQEVAFLFFALLVLALFSEALSGRRRQAVVAALMAALVVSHYSTSYVAVAMLAFTWAAYGLCRLVAATARGYWWPPLWLGARWRREGQVSLGSARRWLQPPRHRAKPSGKPAVGLATVALGIAMILAWDVGFTHSSSNVTKFVSSLVDNGLQILPYGKGPILQRYLSGNVGTVTTPQVYYAETARAARATERWLRPFPVSVTSRYPAHAAPAPYALKPLVNGSARPVTDLAIAVDEVLLVLVGCGVVGSLLSALRGRRRKLGVPLEVAVMCLVLFAFLAVIRLSGTVAGSYNADRAQLQAAIVLSVALGCSLEWLMARLSAGAVVMGALVVMLLAGTGETVALTGGDAPALLANAGTEFNMFVMSKGEVSAARWMVANMGRRGVVYTDEYGPLRIWGATRYTALPQTWLTPGALDKGAWVYVPAYSVVGHTSYGSFRGAAVSYAFPSEFLWDVDNLVYSCPTARVYR